jgi:hypothetical protein
MRTPSCSIHAPSISLTLVHTRDCCQAPRRHIYHTRGDGDGCQFGCTVTNSIGLDTETGRTYLRDMATSNNDEGTEATTKARQLKQGQA